VVRFPYHAGDLKASGAPETIVAKLSDDSGHSTRDIVFTPDNKRMLVSVGSASNDGEGMGRAPGGLKAWASGHPLGAAWGDEDARAAVLSFDPDGKNRKLFATGIRNCVGLAMQPSGTLWCSTNERDGLGDNLVPDYVTRVRENAFYGWPWFYIGDHQDPRHRGERADLKDKITVPDVLLQAHSASLGLTFYDGSNFPAAYRGDAFAAEHGSWNRAKRTGYKIIRIRLKDGVPTGEYEDFVTGFVVNDNDVWGRPVGVAVAHDGALLISEDGNGTIWRVTH
jgi:glucose/arabinose dehydrogenase